MNEDVIRILRFAAELDCERAAENRRRCSLRAPCVPCLARRLLGLPRWEDDPIVVAARRAFKRGETIEQLVARKKRGESAAQLMRPERKRS